MGSGAGRWAEIVVESRGIRGMRTVQGLLSLAGKHTSAKIDRACRLALGHGAYRLKDVRALVDSAEEQTKFEFTAEHPVIRNMNEYGRVVRTGFHDGGAEILDRFPQHAAIVTITGKSYRLKDRACRKGAKKHNLTGSQ